MPPLPPRPDKPSGASRTYRVFFLNHDGSVHQGDALEAGTDDEAQARAAALVNGHGIDLWEGGRFLASYPPLAVSRGAATSAPAEADVPEPSIRSFDPIVQTLIRTSREAIRHSREILDRSGPVPETIPKDAAGGSGAAPTEDALPE